MTDLNHVGIIGRLTRDAELKYTNSGSAVCQFSVANNYRKKSGDQWVDEVNYFDVVLFGKSAEAISRYLSKGKQVGVEGQLRQNRWEQDGQRRSKVEIFANNVQLLGGRTEGGGGERDRGPGFTGPSSGQGRPPESSSGPADFEDDVPF
ncbi:MAG: single-stranded DNA-binding protein [Spirochaetia bacterium]